MSTNTKKETPRKSIQRDHGTSETRRKQRLRKIGESLTWSLRPPYFILNILYMAKTLYRFSIVVVTTILSVGIGKYLSDTLGVDIFVSQFCSTLVMTSMAVFFIIRDMARYRVVNISF